MALRQVFFKTQLSRALWSSGTTVRMMSDGWGSGSGKGGGSGGSVRDAGGKFGEMEAAHEEQYFRKLQAEQIAKLKKSVSDELAWHESQIKEHMEDIERHKKKLEELKEMK